MENRELTLDDYLAMLRRRMKVILLPALLSPLAGLAVSHLPFFPPQYTSKSEVLVTPQRISDAMVPEVSNEDVDQQMNEVAARLKSPASLRSAVERLGLAKRGEN